MFSSVIGRLAQTGLCSVVLQDGWPNYRTAGPDWLVFCSIAGSLALEWQF